MAERELKPDGCCPGSGEVWEGAARPQCLLAPEP